MMFLLLFCFNSGRLRSWGRSFPHKQILVNIFPVFVFCDDVSLKLHPCFVLRSKVIPLHLRPSSTPGLTHSVINSLVNAAMWRELSQCKITFFCTSQVLVDGFSEVCVTRLPVNKGMLYDVKTSLLRRVWKVSTWLFWLYIFSCLDLFIFCNYVPTGK